MKIDSESFLYRLKDRKNNKMIEIHGVMQGLKYALGADWTK